MANGLQALNRAQIDLGEDSPTQSGSAEVGLTEIRPVKVRPDEVRLAEVRFGGFRLAEVRRGKVRPRKVRPAEVRRSEVRRDEVRPPEIRPAELRQAEVRPAEVRPAEVRLEEVCLGKIRPCVRMLLSPLIPGSNALFQDCQMLFIRHRLSPAAPRELPRHISREREGMQQLLAASCQPSLIRTGGLGHQVQESFAKGLPISVVGQFDFHRELQQLAPQHAKAGQRTGYQQ